MPRLAPLSGFPEWSPSQRIVEAQLIASLREVFALHGFAEIDTRAVEPVARLAGDSDAAKEIYTLARLRGVDKAGGEREEASLGLHFDLTVPFARYVEERQGELDFPFRRYQVQKVWRGERPQDGRYREFYQADIDIVGRDQLPAHAESEVAIVMAKALAALTASVGAPQARMRCNDRRLVEGFYAGVGISDVASALRAVDKLPKIGADAVKRELGTLEVPAQAADAVVALAGIAAQGAALGDAARSAWHVHGAHGEQARELFDSGLVALMSLVDAVNAELPGTATGDLSIARGLDYYTGAVYETVLEGHEDLGSICSGGRYDSLVAGGGFPGVGMSIGVSRLVSRLLTTGTASASRSVPSAVLVAVVDEHTRAASNLVANALRVRGIPCEVAPTAAKFGKQIQFADRRGIPFVWFPGELGDQVKDIRSGEQVDADAAVWMPPAADLWPTVVRG